MRFGVSVLFCLDMGFSLYYFGKSHLVELRHLVWGIQFIYFDKYYIAFSRESYRLESRKVFGDEDVSFSCWVSL
jgi:hypothetical protein